MDRFGSSRLRIVWASVSLLLAGLALGSIQGLGEDGTQLIVMRTAIPLGMDARSMALETIGRLIYTLVPAVILLGGILPLGEWLASGAKRERFKGLFMGSGFAFLHGLFLSQVALLPVFAAFYKLFGSPMAHAAVQAVASAEPLPLSPWHQLLQSDLNALLLGLQLLLWTSALGLIVKSNRGLAILMAGTLMSASKILAWISEFGNDIELPKLLVKTTTFLTHVLPTERIPSDPMALTALPLSIGGPLLLSVLLLVLPGKAAKKSKA